MKHIEKEEEFEELIKQNLVLVDFYANWCGPCQMLTPILEELEKENKEITIVKVDVDQNETLARKHGVMSIPYLEVYKSGNLVSKQVGYLSKEELKDLLQ